MRHYILIAATLLLPVLAKALDGTGILSAPMQSGAQTPHMSAVKLSSTPENSPFSKLAAMFENGTLPPAQNLIGWRTGRMFRATSPETPVGVLLAAHWRQPSAESENKVLALRRMENESLHFFDSLNQDKRSELEASITQHKILPRTYLGQNCFYVANANGEDGDKMFIRQMGAYLVFKGYESGTKELYYGYVTGEAK